MQRWFAVHTKAQMEDDAARRLRGQDFEAFLPLCSYERIRHRRRVTITAPLFRRYLFVRFDRQLDGWQSIVSTKHVSGLIPTNISPEPAQQGAIEFLIAKVAAAGGAIPLIEDEVLPFEKGERVKFTEGAFLGFTALVQRDEGARVQVMLDMFGSRHVIPVQRESIARG